MTLSGCLLKIDGDPAVCPPWSRCLGEGLEWGSFHMDLSSPSPGGSLRAWVCRNLLKEVFCPKYTAQTLRAAAGGGEGGWGGERYLSFLLRRGDICSPGVFLCDRPAGRSDTSAPKSPPGSLPGSEYGYESWSRFAKPHLIIQKFDLGKKKRPQTT